MTNPFLPPVAADALLGDVVLFVEGVVWVAAPGDVPVVRQLVNRAAMPPAAPGFVAVGPGRMRRLSTDTRVYFDSGSPTGGTQTYTQSVEYEAAIDCYGAASNDWASALTTLLRSDYGVDNMTVGTPLHADDPIQLPLVDGEEQYEERWRVRLLLQYKPAAITPMQFADTIGSGVSIFPPAR